MFAGAMKYGRFKFNRGQILLGSEKKVIVFLLGLGRKKKFRDFLNNPSEIALSSPYWWFGMALSEAARS